MSEQEIQSLVELWCSDETNIELACSIFRGLHVDDCHRVMSALYNKMQSSSNWGTHNIGEWELAFGGDGKFILQIPCKGGLYALCIKPNPNPSFDDVSDCIFSLKALAWQNGFLDRDFTVFFYSDEWIPNFADLWEFPKETIVKMMFYDGK